MSKWLLALALLLGSVATAHAAQEAICAQSFVILCENFEDRPLGSVNPGGTATGGLYLNLGPKTPPWALSKSAWEGWTIVDPATAAGDYTAIEGSRALVGTYTPCSWPAGSGQTDDYCGNPGHGEIGWSGGRTDIWGRFYSRWSANPVFQWSISADKHGYLNSGKFRNPTMFHFFGTEQVGTSGVPVMFSDDTSVTTNQNTNLPATVISRGAWHCFEIHVTQLSTSRINLDGWIDGVQKFAYTNLAMNTASGGWNTIEFSHYWNIASSVAGERLTQYRWHDAIVVGTQRINCLGPTPLPRRSVR